MLDDELFIQFLLQLLSTEIIVGRYLKLELGKQATYRLTKASFLCFFSPFMRSSFHCISFFVKICWQITPLLKDSNFFITFFLKVGWQIAHPFQLMLLKHTTVRKFHVHMLRGNMIMVPANHKQILLLKFKALSKSLVDLF